jgi:hypothetical protein
MRAAPEKRKAPGCRKPSASRKRTTPTKASARAPVVNGPVDDLDELIAEMAAERPSTDALLARFWSAAKIAARNEHGEVQDNPDLARFATLRAELLQRAVPIHAISRLEQHAGLDRGHIAPPAPARVAEARQLLRESGIVKQAVETLRGCLQWAPDARDRLRAARIILEYGGDR